MITRRLGRSPDFEGERTFVKIFESEIEGTDCGVEGGATGGDLVTYTSRARIPTGLCCHRQFWEVDKAQPDAFRGPYQLQPYNTTSFVLLQHFRLFSANMINIFEINLGNNKVALNAYK